MTLAIQFLHPYFLYGLFFLAIPVLIHLFSLKKYKKVYFSNFTFLEALQQQRKNSSKLKNLLLLLLRLFVLACIVVTFAVPFSSPEHRQTNHSEHPEVVIYADNSFSMTNTGTQGSLLEEAKKYLFDVVNTYPNGTAFRLLTNDRTEDLLLRKEQMQQALSNLKISPASKKLSEIYKEVNELSGKNINTLFVVSDFQKQNCDFQHITADSAYETVFLVLKPENRNNLYIKDIKFEQAFHQKNQNDKIYITIANASGKEFHNIPVALTINDKKKNIVQTDVAAKGEKTLAISYINQDEGFYKGIAELADFPVVFDNKFYFSYTVNGNAEVLYLWQDEMNPYFGKLFADTTLFRFTSFPAGQLTDLNLSRYHLIILDGATETGSGLESALEEYITRGGNLFLLPGTANVQSQNRFLKKLQAPQFMSADTGTRIAQIETQAALFRNVFEQVNQQMVLPYVRNFYPLSSGNQTEKLLSDKQGNTLLAAKPFGKGNLYVSAFNFRPENSDIVYHPLFIPLLANMACRINSALNTCYFLNSTVPVTVNNKNYQENIPVQIRKEDHSFEYIPELRKDYSGDLLLSNSNTIRDAGIYEVVQENKVIDLLAWNYNRSESQMEFVTEEELHKYFPHSRIGNIKTTQLERNSDLVKEIVLQDNNKYLAPWFLLLAIAGLLLEQIVWKKKLN